MPKGYHQLTYEQRCQIYALKKRNFSHTAIANDIKVSRATITRELLRNNDNGKYNYRKAQKKAINRRSNANSAPYRMTETAKSFILQELKATQASPEQISGRMALLGMQKISHESIYRMIREDKRRGGCLYMYLRHRSKKYNKTSGKAAGRGCIPDRVGIEERPAIVEEKKRLGDMELDTIIGSNHKGAIVSIVDRASKITLLALVGSKKSKVVTKAITRKLRPFQGIVKTLTPDNGKEFTNHKELTKKTGAAVYFAHPYSSWERGLNEHTNGLVRQYLPKKTNFHKIKKKYVQEIENILNNRPRKILNFRTPNEVFAELLKEENGALHC